MEYIIAFALFLVVLAFFAFIIVACIKERSIREKYAGVFGRLGAYFSVYLIGILYGLIAAVAVLVSEGLSLESLSGAAGAFLGGVLLGCIGLVPILMARKKCPPHLLKGLVISMLLAGWGVSIKISLRIALFFLPFFAGGLWPAPVEQSSSNEAQEEYYDKDTGQALRSNRDRKSTRLNSSH